MCLIRSNRLLRFKTVIDHAVSLIQSYLSEPYASLLSGILFGTKLTVTRTFYDDLKYTGLIHLVVLSGMNISILSASVVNLIVKVAGRIVAMYVAIVVILCVIATYSDQAPAVRAGIMGILSYTAMLFGRKTFSLHILLTTSVIMLFYNPDWLTSISFQLSFAATLGIILFGSSNTETDSTKKKKELSTSTRFKEYIAGELRTTLSAQAFTAPLIFWHFRQISYVAPLTNILVSWTIPPIMFTGLLTVVLGTFSWHLGFVASWISYGFIAYLVAIVELFH